MNVALGILPVRFSSLLPIDLAYLSAYLKGRGHRVYARDFNAEMTVSNDSDGMFWNCVSNQEELLKKNKAIVEEWVGGILDFRPDVVGFSVWESQQSFSLLAAGMIKDRKKDARIVFGGPWPSLRKFIEFEQVDFVVFGEGEETLAAITELGDFKGAIAGCLRKVDGNVLEGGWRQEVRDINTLPFPDYADFHPRRYLLNTTYPILFNRGCNWDCSFCSHRASWRKFRSRSAENIFSEIRHCLYRYPFMKRFQSCDHSMNSNMAELLKLCDLIIASGIRIREYHDDSQIWEFAGFGQINPQMLEEDILRKLKRAGFKNWGIGLQTGSDRILKSMRRPYTAGQAELMLEVMRKSGMPSPSIDLIVGYPEETEEDFLETLEFVSRAGKYVGNISVAPYCSVCGNDLESYPQRYGITSLNGGGDYWESVANTPAIRKERYRTIMEYLSARGISHRYSDEDRKFMSRNES